MTLETLTSKIKVLRDIAWDGRPDQNELNQWLENFATLNEKENAIHLLSNFVYFGNLQVRQMLRALFREKFRYPIMRRLRRDNGMTKDVDLLEELFKKKLESTRFLGIGNPSESGCHLLYYFRQENALPKSVFINTHDIFSRTEDGRASSGDPFFKLNLKSYDIDHYVFIDDFCGSGSQAVSYSQDLVEQIKDLNPAATVDYLVLIGNGSGLEYVRENSEFDQVSSIYELDESFQCFHATARQYLNPLDGVSVSKAKRMALKYGVLVNPDDPLGFDNGELLIGFHHNTPDNTLPIIWASQKDFEGWSPIFKRYQKIYE